SELGIFGFAAFAFLVVRAYSASFKALRLLKGPRQKRGAASRGPSSPKGAIQVSVEERYILDTNAKGMIAAIVGWSICSLFASVAFNWTFYYVLALAVAGREIAMNRRSAPAPGAEPVAASRLVRAHA